MYPTLGLKPKHHFLLHMPMQLLRFGPLRNQWLFRFESKNNSFKNFKFKNFINIPLSMAKHHQMALCYSFMNSLGERSDNYLYSGDSVKEGREVNILDEFPQLVNDFKAILQVQDIDKVYETQEVVLSGLKYKTGACVLRDWQLNVPSFGLIEKIYVYDLVKIVVLCVFQTEEFDWTKNAFRVSRTDEYEVKKLYSLKNKWPLPIYGNYITNRYCHFGQGLFLIYEFRHLCRQARTMVRVI